MTSRRDRIKEAKFRLPICTLWRTLGLPGEPKVNRAIKSPLRKDDRPSFIISSDGFFFKDFNGESGDAVNFIQCALGLDQRTAINRLLELAGLSDEDAKKEDFSLPERIEFAPIVGSRDLVALPNLSEGTEMDWARLAELRKVTIEAVYAMVKRGLIRFSEYNEHYAFFALDKTRCNVQARRMDGKLWWDKIKALSLKSSIGGWPVGVSEAEGMLVIVEGSGDYLAAMQLIIDEMVNASPVGMFGASQEIDAGALPLMRGRDICIIPQNDVPKPRMIDGKEVMVRAGDVLLERLWAQLEPIAGSLHVAYLPESVKVGEETVKIKDVNEWTSNVPWEIRSRKKLLPTL